MSETISKFREEIYCCTRCNTCKLLYQNYDLSCPSGVKFVFESFWPSGKMHIARGLYEDKIEWTERLRDVIFACPTCANCTVQCQSRHHDTIVDIIESLRADCVSRGLGPLPNQKTFGESTEKEHNPYKEKHEDRLNWADGIEVKQKLQADILYFVGCTSSYRQQELARNTVKILNKLDVDYTVSEDEWCCGSPLMRTGQLNVVDELIKHNLELIKELGAKKVITSCAGCYRTLKVDYPKYTEMLEGVEILHITQFLSDYIMSKKLKLKNDKDIKLTYHDPCHLGRHAGVYDTPREIINSLSSVELIEMPRNRENSWCCGAGGGVKAGFRDWAVEIASERVKEAEETGAEILLSTCPFCATNLKDAIKATDSNLKFMDLVDLLDQML
ncbi:MAG: (Fe-S)-binding protein [Candidatus Lokiarchaeota archaeon]|nr:(Fe-S)-binding protein [Candidatus Lokiarchaeota archaeon]